MIWETGRGLGSREFEFVKHQEGVDTSATNANGATDSDTSAFHHFLALDNLGNWADTSSGRRHLARERNSVLRKRRLRKWRKMCPERDQEGYGDKEG
jgi:hypothetical protein